MTAHKPASSGRIVFLNGEYVNEHDARVPFFDRGFMFGDGVYEVTARLAGRFVDFDLHRARLRRSLAEIGLELSIADAELLAMHERLAQMNGLADGTIYMQVTRCAADRDFLPQPGAAAHVVAFTQRNDIVANVGGQKGIAIRLAPDLRWRRRDIKTVGLLAQAMTKRDAKAASYDDAWFVEEGLITEGTSSSAFIVDTHGTLITRQLGPQLLPGITRQVILAIARDRGLAIEERAFTPDELRAAAEAFATSASTFVLPVISVEGSPIGSGRPGPITSGLRAAYIERAKARFPQFA